MLSSQEKLIPSDVQMLVENGTKYIFILHCFRRIYELLSGCLRSLALRMTDVELMQLRMIQGCPL